MVSKDALMGGTTRHCVELCRTLSTLQVEVTLLVPGVLTKRRATELDLRGLNTRRPPSFGRVFSTELCPGLIWQTGTEPADIVHAHLPSPLAVTSLLLHSRRPLVVTYHCDLDRSFGPLGRVYEAAARRVLQRADAIVISTDHLRTSAALRGLDSRVRTIPFGIARDRLRVNDEMLADLRARHGDRLVLFVGRLVYYKGVDVLLRAMVNVAGTLVIVGDGAEREKLVLLARRLGLSDRVRFVGRVSESMLDAYYSLARALVLPSVSRGEAFGIVQVEAALFGCPTVCTSLPGVSWVNLNEQTGLVVPPREPHALARAIQRLLDDEELATRLGRTARARALELFAPPAMGARMLALYRDVCGVAKQHPSSKNAESI